MKYAFSLVAASLLLTGCGHAKPKIDMNSHHIPDASLQYINAAPPAERAHLMQQFHITSMPKNTPAMGGMPASTGNAGGR